MIAERLSRVIARKAGLKNLNLESRDQPRPIQNPADRYRAEKKNGLVLELWMDEWSFSEVAGKPGHAGMRFDARSRLTRVADGRILWSSGRCQVGGTPNRAYRISSTDLTKPARLRKLMADARNECVRQIARDFDNASAK